MHGLPQAEILANKLLLTHLTKHRYHPCAKTHGHFTHKTSLIAFSLIVNDFRVKYVGQKHANHLFQALKEQYTVTANLAGGLFLSMKLNSNYHKSHVEFFMSSYIKKKLLTALQQNHTHKN
jgi:hypothetical protein